MAGFKKANAPLDVIVIFVMIIVVSITLFIIGGSINPVWDSLKDEPDLSNTSKQIITDRAENTASTYDNMVLIIFIALWLFALYSASQIDTNPALLVVSLIALSIVFFVAVLLAQGVSGIFDSASFADFTENMPMTNWILDNLLAIGIFMGFTVLIALFAKAKVGN